MPHWTWTHRPSSSHDVPTLPAPDSKPSRQRHPKNLCAWWDEAGAPTTAFPVGECDGYLAQSWLPTRWLCRVR